MSLEKAMETQDYLINEIKRVRNKTEFDLEDETYLQGLETDLMYVSSYILECNGGRFRYPYAITHRAELKHTEGTGWAEVHYTPKLIRLPLFWREMIIEMY